MKKCPLPVPRVALFAALLLTLLAGSVFAQFQTGNIFGKVASRDGTPVPGVTVTLTGVGAPQTFVTDSEGDFRFLNLSPGTYQLKAELSGFGSATRAGVTVSIGQNAEVKMAMAPTVAESITVTAEAPLLDVRKTGTGATVSKVEMDAIPSSRDPWTVLQSVPSVQVDRINVGGSQSGQQSVYVGKGSDSSQNTWNIDGVNITDMGATGASPMYFDFDTFEEMQITTGGSDPRIQTPGVQLNMVTKRGTNDFKGSGRDFYTPGSYQADATVPDEASTYLELTNRINYVRDYGGEIGGPIWRDHLWFWIAAGDQKISVQASQPPGRIGAFDNIILRNKNAKLNGQITASNSAVGNYTFSDKVRNARNISATRPFDTSWKQTGPAKVYKLEDTHIFGSSFYLTGMWSKVDGGFQLAPNGGMDPNVVIWRDINAVWQNSFLFYGTERPQKQLRLDGSKFFDLGNMNHELKFGFGYRDTPVDSLSTWPGINGGFMRDRPASYCAARGEANVTRCTQSVMVRDASRAYAEKYNEYYIGDTILMRNLTVQVGLRYDTQKSSNSPSTAKAQTLLGSTSITLPCSPQRVASCGGPTLTTSLPALAFGGDARDLQWNSISPRIGLTYALGADKKTLLRAGYNRYVEQLGSIVSSTSPLGYPSYLYTIADDRNGDHTIQRSELLRITGWYYFDPKNPTSTDSTIRVDYGMAPPRTDELVIGGERELFTDFIVGANLTYRKSNDLTYFRPEKTQGAGDWYTRNDYQVAGQTSGTYALPDGGTVTTPVVNYYDLKPGIPAPQFFVLTNRADYSRTYTGVELTAAKRLSHKWMLRGNISWRDWTEDCGQDAVSDPTPFLGNCPGGQFTQRSAGSGSFGNVFINAKWTYNLTGLYQLPWDFSFGASLIGRQGYPRPFREEVETSTARTVVIEPIGDTRFDNVYELDLRVAKDFRFFDRVGVTLSADLFNAPNKRTILQRETNMSAGNANRITELQSPRVWRFGAKINF